MAFTPVPTDEFRRLHAARINSAEWKAFRKHALAYYGYRCAVCDKGYLRRGYKSWQLQVDHRRYRDADGLIFGRESMADVRVLCPDHHRRGVHSDSAIRSYGNSVRWLAVLEWLILLPFRLARRLLRFLWRRLRGAPKGVR